MLHTLVLVKIKNGGTEHFLETFLQVALIYGYFPAQFLDGDGITNMFNQDLPGHADLLPICFIMQELTGDHGFFLHAHHALHAVQQQDLRLRIDEDIFQCIRIVMVQQGVNAGAHFTAEGQDPGEGSCGAELHDIL